MSIAIINNALEQQELRQMSPDVIAEIWKAVEIDCCPQ
jgi:hypothetical protein